ncbi:MAG: SRPBCC family protein, partial [Ktedonobacteraceae bacterium]
MNNKLCLGLLAGVSGAYLLRRLGMRWGATDDEVHRPLPGDDLVPHPMLETTHAISIHASRADIW